MGALNRGERGFVFLDTLIAIFVLVIGISGMTASIASLNRYIERNRERTIELIERKNEYSTRWYGGE